VNYELAVRSWEQHKAWFNTQASTFRLQHLPETCGWKANNLKWTFSAGCLGWEALGGCGWRYVLGLKPSSAAALLYRPELQSKSDQPSGDLVGGWFCSADVHQVFGFSLASLTLYQTEGIW
jgi:hypothetical protein